MGQAIYQLQIVRAAAALSVVAFHAQGELHHRGFSDPFPDLTIGAFGVDLFFVVSGFIMVISSDRFFGRAGQAWPFMARRIARIAPLYWVVTAAFAAIAVHLSRLPGHPPASVAHILASFLFLPALRPEDGAYLPVCALGWTLNYEMFFYACFAAAIRLRRGLAVAVLSAALTGLVAAGRWVVLPWPLTYWADPIILEFVFGLWLGSAHRAGWRMPVPVGLPVAFVVLAGMALSRPYIDAVFAWRGLAWGIPAALLVAAVAGIGAPGTGPAARAAARVGDASYSLYLVHSALFIVAFALVSAVMDPHAIPSAAYAALLVLSSVAAALALFRWFETPVTRSLQARLGRYCPPQPAAGQPLDSNVGNIPTSF